ncbi:ankyrin repeat domain-containing protein [Candidatus Uabimicrobium sp. HlEnr_7]|uniref:ankyrin repeat domain-containing protein n=1 Tax=Candidatus Uabimicrobium helgolandensis TaxID=3095367 RepID=UPI003557FE78
MSESKSNIKLKLVGLLVLIATGITVYFTFEPKPEESWEKAIERGNHENVSYLIKKYPRLLNHKIDGYSPLIISAREGDTKVVSILLNAGAAPEKLVGGITALHMACWTYRVEVVRLLLKRGVNPQVKDIDKNTPLKFMQGNYQLLLERLKKDHKLAFEEITKLLKGS